MTNSFSLKLPFDKYLHLNASLIITSFFTPIMGEYSKPFTLSIGIGKEIYDYVSKKGTCEFYDLLADIYGIFLIDQFKLDFENSKIGIAFCLIF
jgi:hypothetical protein